MKKLKKHELFEEGSIEEQVFEAFSALKEEASDAKWRVFVRTFGEILPEEKRNHFLLRYGEEEAWQHVQVPNYWVIRVAGNAAYIAPEAAHRFLALWSNAPEQVTWLASDVAKLLYLR